MPKGVYPRTEYHRFLNSRGHMGKEPWNKGRKGLQRHSEETKKIIAAASRLRVVKDSTKLKISIHQMGESNSNWKQGSWRLLQKERSIIMHRREYKAFRAIVLARDGHRCVWCGATELLEVDHIKSFWEYPELRTKPSNGRTLCRPCHTKTPTYGVRPRISASHKEKIR